MNETMAHSSTGASKAGGLGTSECSVQKEWKNNAQSLRSVRRSVPFFPEVGEPLIINLHDNNNEKITEYEKKRCIIYGV